jgi:signal transduction histidine kinase
VSAVLDYLPRGNTLSDEEWLRRHRLLQWVLAAHLPALFLFGVLRGFRPSDVAETMALPLACLIIGHLMRSRRLAATFITLGLVYCSAALVGFSDGAIEAHFHFFIIIGFIALYQDWVPFLLDILFTVLSHGIGSSFVPDLMFNHVSAQQRPWEWSLIHGVAVLAACVGVVLFWKNTEDEQGRSLNLTKQLADAEISRRRFTSDLLVNLARRNQNLLYRQLDLLNDLEDKERDPDALADLFRLDHLATRIRRNAENLLVISGEESPRTWREPVPLADVMRAAIAEIEDLDRVDESVDETLAVSGRSVADLTHLFAELLENAVHFSPPGVTVVVRSRPLPSTAGTHLVTIEDWGVGMTPAEMAEANEILRRPREVDLAVSQRLGLHVIARLAQRYGIRVELTPTPGGGVTAVATLPQSTFDRSVELVGAAAGRVGGADAAGQLEPPSGSVRMDPALDAAHRLDRAPGAGNRLDPGPHSYGSYGSNGTAAHLNGAPADVRSTPFDTPAPDFRPGAGSVPPGYPPAGQQDTGPGNGRPNGPRGFRPGAGGPEDPHTAGGGPGVEAPGPSRPGRPTPPLLPDPTDADGPRRAAGDADGSLPRRDPGEALAPNRQPMPEPPTTRSAPVRPDMGDPARGPRPDMGEPARGPRPDADPPVRSQRSDQPVDRGDVRAGFRELPAGGDGAAQAGRGTYGQAGEEAAADGWSSWWTRSTPPGEPRPDPEPWPEPRPAEPNGSGPVPLPEPRPPAEEGQQLRRRVPQANLAAGLRRDNGAQPHDEAPVVRDPMAARNALSRFQAAQRAARDAVDGGRGEDPR